MKEATFTLLDDVNLKIHLTKGYFLPMQIGERLGMVPDYVLEEFRAHNVRKLNIIAALAKFMICKATTNKRWVSIKVLAFLAGKSEISTDRDFCC